MVYDRPGRRVVGSTGASARGSAPGGAPGTGRRRPTPATVRLRAPPRRRRAGVNRSKRPTSATPGGREPPAPTSATPGGRLQQHGVPAERPDRLVLRGARRATPRRPEVLRRLVAPAPAAPCRTGPGSACSSHPVPRRRPHCRPIRGLGRRPTIAHAVRPTGAWSTATTHGSASSSPSYRRRARRPDARHMATSLLLGIRRVPRRSPRRRQDGNHANRANEVLWPRRTA